MAQSNWRGGKLKLVEVEVVAPANNLIYQERLEAGLSQDLDHGSAVEADLSSM